MKTVINIKSFLPIACILCALLFACENPWMAEIVQEKTITFNSNGGSHVPSQKLYVGERVKEPAAPEHPNGLTFLGWYEDNETFKKLYNFDFIPTHSMTLYANWKPEGNGNSGDNATPDITVSSSLELKDFLDKQDENNSANPYRIKLNVSNTEFPNGTLDGSITEIIEESGKFVSLELTGNTLTTIGDSAFNGCKYLTGITMPNSVTSIEKYAFYGTSLTSVTIPDSVTSIGGHAFYCPSLTSVEFQGTITSSNFDNAAFPGNLQEMYLACGTGTYTRQSGSTLWKPEIFKGIDGLISWLTTQPENNAADDLPYTVKLNIDDLSLITRQIKDTIVDSILQINLAEKGPQVKRKVNLDFSGSTFTVFPEGFFSSCAWLTGITIPSSVTEIEKFAFYDSRLNSVTFLGTINSDKFDINAFNSCGDLRDKFYETNQINGTPGTYTRSTVDPYPWIRQHP